MFALAGAPLTGSQCQSPGTPGPGTLHRPQAGVEQRPPDYPAPLARVPMRRAAHALIPRPEFRPHRGSIDNPRQLGLSAEPLALEIAEVHTTIGPQILPLNPLCRR